MEWISTLDMSILDGIQGSLKCAFMDVFMPIITFLGNYGIIWLLCVAVMLVFRKHRICGICMLAALVLSLLVCNLILKNLVARIRPCDVKAGFELLIAHPSGFSFPSGHSASSFAAATAIFMCGRRLGAAALVLAALIAFSRLYLFVHYPTDVLCGAILGVALGIIAAVTVKRLYPLVSSRFSRARESGEK